MNKKINYEVEPLFASNEEKEKGLCFESWVLVSASTNEKTKIFYFNSSINPEEYKDFKEFVESNMEAFISSKDASEPNKIIKDNYSCISSFSGKFEKDFDEEIKKSFKIAVGQANIMEFFKGGIKLDKIHELVENTNKYLKELENEGVYQIIENENYRSHPYKY